MRSGKSGIDRRRLLGAGAALGAGPAIAAGLPGTARAAAATPPVRVTAADERYVDLISGWNQRWVSHPESVFLVTEARQIAALVEQAVASGRQLTVRSGGHCYEDFAYQPDTQVILDLTGMNKVGYDDQRGAFFVEPGALLLDVYEQLYRRFGVTIPAGVCFQVGAGGHVAGGGWGLLCRELGLVVDYLAAVEVVVVGANGKARTIVATREPNDPNRELWWAHTGGGGGNFGVVTRYWFATPGATGTDPAARLPHPPAEVVISAVSWSWSELTKDDFTRLVRNYGRWHEQHSAPGDPYAGLCSLFSLNHRKNGAVGLVTQMDGSVPDAEGLIEAFVSAVAEGVGAARGHVTTSMGELGPLPGLANARRMPWMHASRMLGTANPTTNDPTLKGDFKSAYMKRALPQSQIDAYYEHLTREDLGNTTASVMLSSFGGRVNTVAPDATAFPHRDSVFKAIWMIWWTDPAQEQPCLSWIREFYEQVYAATGGVPVPSDLADGCYLNYADIDLNDPARNRSGVPWSELYYRGNYPRLQRVKEAYDPLNFFRHGQSVRLPSA